MTDKAQQVSEMTQAELVAHIRGKLAEQLLPGESAEQLEEWAEYLAHAAVTLEKLFMDVPRVEKRIDRIPLWSMGLLSMIRGYETAAREYKERIAMARLMVEGPADGGPIL